MNSTEDHPADDSVTPDSPSQDDSTHPLKVALFTDNYGPGHSGLLYAVQFLESELLDRGHEVLVVAPETEGPNPHAGRSGRTEYRLHSLQLPRIPVAMASGKGFEKALRWFDNNRPDVIHVHGLGSVGMLGVWAADRLQVPLMVTWHTDFEAYVDHYKAFAPFFTAYYKLLKASVNGMNRPKLADMRRWAFKWPRRGMSRRGILGAARDMLEAADVVTTPSDKTASRVYELAPASLIRVCPNGTDPLPDAPALPKPTHPRILYVGRIAPEKNIELLIDAFDWVREYRPDAELMVVGDWKKFEGIRRKLARARRRGGVVLVGQVPHDDLKPYYDSADLFAFPSLTDTQALVLHEAAHSGLPIVSVDSELTLVIDRGVNGMFARPTPGAFAQAMLAMLNRLDDPAFKARAQERSREMAGWWTIQHQSEEILRLYEQLALREPIEPQLNAVPPKQN